MAEPEAAERDEGLTRNQFDTACSLARSAVLNINLLIAQAKGDSLSVPPLVAKLLEPYRVGPQGSVPEYSTAELVREVAQFCELADRVRSSLGPVLNAVRRIATVPLHVGCVVKPTAHEIIDEILRRLWCGIRDAAVEDRLTAWDGNNDTFKVATDVVIGGTIKHDVLESCIEPIRKFLAKQEQIRSAELDSFLIIESTKAWHAYEQCQSPNGRNPRVAKDHLGHSGTNRTDPLRIQTGLELLPWDEKTEARNCWIYEQALALIPHKNVLTELKSLATKNDWEAISSIPGLRRAAEAYSARHPDRPQLPKRRAGRKSKRDGGA